MQTSNLNYLYEIQESEAFGPILLPGYDEAKGHYIDLKKRTIDAPQYLSVQKDHNSNVIYFVVDRFFDYMDLSSLACIIQYITPSGKVGVYPIPYYDIYSRVDYQQMVIPWCVDQFLTEEPGWIQYSFRFFKVVDTATGKQLVYNLNTSPVKSEILIGLDAEIPIDSQLKPCVCANTNIEINYEQANGIYYCVIQCKNEDCEKMVTASGYSQEEALIKASTLWNTREEEEDSENEQEENIAEGTGFHAQVYEILTQHIRDSQTYWTFL